MYPFVNVLSGLLAFGGGRGVDGAHIINIINTEIRGKGRLVQVFSIAA